MALLVVAVVVGFLVARLREPLGARTPRLRFEWMPLLGLGAALNLVAYALDGRAATLAMAASLVLLLGFVGVNPTVTGIAVIGVGLFANLLGLVLNDGMPVRGGALVAADVVDAADLDTVSFSGPRHLETDADLVPVLGDVLPLPVGREVVSFGDLIVVLGAADAVRELARRRRTAWSAEQRAAYRASLAAPAPAGATAPPGDGRPGPDAGPDGVGRPTPGVIDLAGPPRPSRRRLVAAGHRGT